ncbi:MAG: hypothetical protein N2A40_01110 [Desulfobulbaceae bacterium]
MAPSKKDSGQIDLDRLVAMTSGFTPADIVFLFQQVAHFAFEQELASKKDHLVTTETIIHLTSKALPSLSDEVIE